MFSEKMITIQYIKVKWDKYLVLPFPEFDEFDAGDRPDLEDDLFVLDSDMAGCIDTFFDRNGEIDRLRYDILSSGVSQSHDALPVLAAESWSAYFSTLASVAEDVLLYVKNHQDR